MSYRITLRHSTGGVLDEKEGDSIADLLNDYADEGCLSGGDTLEIVDLTDEEDEPDLAPERCEWETGDRAGAWDLGDRGEIVGFTDDMDVDGYAFALLKLDYGTTDNQPAKVSVQALSVLDDE